MRLMKVIVFMIIFLGILIYEDLILRVSLIFLGHKNARRIAQKRHVAAAGLIFKMADRFVNFKIDFQAFDKALPKNFILISNHQSLIEIGLFIWLFREHKLRFVAKEPLFHWVPYISLILRLLGSARISRTGKVSRTMKDLERLARMSGEKELCPVIYPEGTRSPDGELGRFHTGGVKLIEKVTPLPLVCIAINGGYELSHVDRFFAHLGREMWYRAKVLHVFPAPRNKEEVESFLGEAKVKISTQLSLWQNTEKVPS